MEERMTLGSPSAVDIFNLKGRVALITGASSGLGERFAEVAAANGASVVLTARREDKLKEIAVRIEKDGGKAAYAVCDVTDNASMAKAFDVAEKKFGIVDLFVANAGMARLGKVLEMPEDEYRKLMALDMDAVFFNSREAAKRMIAANKPGAIITTASIAAFIVERNIVAYNMAKAAVMQFTKGFALEVARKNIQVNAIAPGYVVTDINRDYLLSAKGQEGKEKLPLARYGEVDDLDGTFLLLASSASRWMTGSTIVIDGGHILTVGG
jgi:NAD(P)-dependent dehydrogenase (short-subunit alcohol dehydrogenase family)